MPTKSIAAKRVAKATDEGYSLLDHFLEMLFAEGHGYACMMEAYFDETEFAPNVATEAEPEKKTSAVIVAGYLFKRKHTKQFHRKLKRRLDKVGVRIFHTTDCVARQREFKNLGDECSVLLKDVIRLVTKHVAFGAVVAIAEDDFNRLAPEGWFQLAGGAYSAAVQLCMAAVGQWVRRNDPTETVAYVFERGHKSWREANVLLNRIEDDPVLAQAYCFKTAGFMSKQEVRPFDAADLLAWEFNKLLKMRWRQPHGKLNPRKSLLALNGVPTSIEMLDEANIPQLFADSIAHGLPHLRNARRN